MEKSSAILLLPLLALLIATPSADAHGISYIIKICKRAAHHNSEIDLNCCINALKAVPESYTTEVKGLLEITTKLALVNATSTIELIHKLNSIACADFTKADLGICLGAYTKAVATLKASISGGLAKLHTVSGGISVCQDALKLHGHEELLSQENNNLHQLVLISKALDFFVNKHSGGSAKFSGSGSGSASARFSRGGSANFFGSGSGSIGVTLPIHV